MKISSILLLILISVSSCSQTVTINDVNKAIDAKLSVFNKTLDSVIVKGGTTNGMSTITIDTLNIGNVQSGYFTLIVTATNKSNGEIASGEKRISVRKISNTTRLIRDYNVMPFSGDTSVTNASWLVQYLNGVVVVKVNGLWNKTIQWSLSKQLQF